MSEDTKQLGMWGDTDEDAKEVSFGSGGIIASTRIAMVYKIYTATPTDQAETVVEVPVGGGDEGKAIRKAKMEELKKRAADGSWLDSKGQPANRVQYGAQMTCRLDGAYSKGAPATWKGDRVFNLDQWTEAYKKAFVPAAVAAGILTLPFDGWCQVGFEPDPFGATEIDNNGESRVKLIAVPRKVFTSKEEAMEVAKSGADDAPSASATCPPGYTDTSWGNLKPTIVTMLKTEVEKGTPPPDAANAIATQWGVDAKFILPLIAEIG